MNFLKKYNIIPKSIKYYNIAFTHSSYSHENNLDYNYERLEFLGDAVLELVVTDYLFNKLDVKEGEMSRLRANYVCENALYKYAKEIELSKFIKVGNGEKQSGGQEKKAIMADIFEALIGAIYLDLGYNKAKQFIEEVVFPHIENNEENDFLRDYKSELQEKVQTNKKSVEYELIGESGPAHNKTFEMAVKIDDIVYGTAKAKTKKEAEQMAAKVALDKEVSN
ncbi:MAG: ribonuclease III [Firmicutes bacterium]|nr:ribonuclease III [Bacillota bacterium]